MNGTFIDTSAFVAVADRRDQHHADAVDTYSKLFREEPVVFTTSYVFLETATLLRRWLGYEPSVRFGEGVLSSRWIHLIRPDDTLDRSAWSLFRKERNPKTTYADCASFAVMKATSLRRAFSFDSGFAEAGFDLIPEGGSGGPR